MPSKFSEKIFTSLRPSYEDPCQLVEKPPSLRIASVLQRGCTLSRNDVSKTRGTPWNFGLFVYTRGVFGLKTVQVQRTTSDGFALGCQTCLAVII